MWMIFVVAGVVLAGLIVVGSLQLRSLHLRVAAGVCAAIVLLFFFTLASFRRVDEDMIGVVSKSIGFASLPPGKIIATEGEKGPQAAILPPGWHPWYWPFIYDIDYQPVVEIEQGQIGMLTASDGLPLPAGATYAPLWEGGTERRMAQDAAFFLTDGDGYKGPQTSVLKPGKYRLNPKLFKMTSAEVLTIRKEEVGVVKSNVGDPAIDGDANLEVGGRKLVNPGQRGIWRTELAPGQYYEYSHTKAYEVETISTRKQIVHYTAGRSVGEGVTEESEIMVRTSDGFTFPVDVRIEYEVEPQNAPLLVASVGDDLEGLRSVMNSAVRAIFRNNAESVKALDYVQQRSLQESESLKMLQDEMTKIGVTISGVRIGDVGDEETLGDLLKTQKDREIALQEQETFKEQQRAAEQQKELTRTEQEAEEEKRLATASYEVKIAEQDKQQKIITAGAEAEAVRIKAEAQADAYELIAQQIGKGNAALVELLKIVGENNVSITPRVMVIGEGGASSQQSAETTALIGTMLDTMVRQAPPEEDEVEPSST
ncbi:MAG: SPFH domain-containing protein [Planctomycetota bacterium]